MTDTHLDPQDLLSVDVESTEPVPTTYSQDELAAVDETIWDVWHKRPGVPIHLRLQPQVYMPKGSGGMGIQRRSHNLAWRGVYWNLDVPNPSTAFAVRDALEAMMKLIGVVPARQVVEELDRIYTRVVQDRQAQLEL